MSGGVGAGGADAVAEAGAVAEAAADAEADAEAEAVALADADADADADAGASADAVAEAVGGGARICGSSSTLEGFFGLAVGFVATGGGEDSKRRTNANAQTAVEAKSTRARTHRAARLRRRGGGGSDPTSEASI